MILLLVFGSLASLALWATWHDRDLFWVGAWLMTGFIVSNILHATLPPSDLPGPYSLIEFMILLATSVAWGTHRGYWPLLLLGGVNIFSICANVAFAANIPANPRQVFLWELTTNLSFVAECLLAAGVGIYDGYRIGRFRRVPRPWRRGLAADAARSKGEPR